MSEYRFDPFHGTWVAIATIRGERPHDFRQLETRVADSRCPFCRGREQETPPAVLQLSHPDLPPELDPGLGGAAGSADWLVRVVPNKYPALTPRPPLTPRRAGPYIAAQHGGCQEIVIESPRHVASLSELTAAEMFLTLRAFQLRLTALAADSALAHVSLFMNCRPEAGASLEHAHAQLIATPILADPIAERWRNCERYWAEQQVNLVEAMRQWERAEKVRVLEDLEGWTAFCPFASRFPLQMWIVPAEPGGNFAELQAGALAVLGGQIQRCLQRLEQVHPRAPYNLLFHLPPLRPGTSAPSAAHGWFIEILPRLGRLAGFELLGAGWVNEAPPELAAARLRESSRSS